MGSAKRADGTGRLDADPRHQLGADRRRLARSLALAAHHTSALISTEAPTTPSITLSNWEPLTRLGFQYELFLTKLSSQPILYNGVEQVGEPRLFGSRFSIEPFPGWSVGINRMLEFGGGSGLPDSASFVARQFFKPSGLSQNLGNQQASYVTRFVSPTRVPFALYFQYAGEDTELGGSFLLAAR